MNALITLRLAYTLGILFNNVKVNATVLAQLDRQCLHLDHDDNQLDAIKTAVTGMNQFMAGVANWRPVKMSLAQVGDENAIEVHIGHCQTPYVLCARFSYDTEGKLDLEILSLEWDALKMGQAPSTANTLFLNAATMLNATVTDNRDPDNVLVWPDLTRTLHGLAETSWMSTSGLTTIRRSLTAIPKAE